MAHVLILGEKVDMMNVIGLLLELEGFTAASANNIPAVQACLHENFPNLIIFILGIRELEDSGIWCYVRESQDLCKLPVVFLTSKQHLKSKSSKNERFAYTCLGIPFEPLDLLEQIDSLLS